MSPDLTRLLEDPTRVAEVPPEAIAGLLAELEQVRTTLWIRLMRAQVNGQGQPEAPAEDRLLTIPEVADRLGVPKGYAYELARRGEIPTVRFGKYVRVSVSAFQEWVAGHQERALDTLRSLSHSRQAKAQARTRPATAKS